ncbi:MAG: hypothetical protein ACREDY_06170 [Bradyrhizobium sp.]
MAENSGLSCDRSTAGSVRRLKRRALICIKEAAPKVGVELSAAVGGVTVVLE